MGVEQAACRPVTEHGSPLGSWLWFPCWCARRAEADFSKKTHGGSCGPGGPAGVLVLTLGKTEAPGVHGWPRVTDGAECPRGGGSASRVLAGFGKSGQLNMNRCISRTRESLEYVLIGLDSYTGNAYHSVHRMQSHSLVYKTRAPLASGDPLHQWDILQPRGLGEAFSGVKTMQTQVLLDEPSLQMRLCGVRPEVAWK